MVHISVNIMMFNRKETLQSAKRACAFHGVRRTDDNDDKDDGGDDDDEDDDRDDYNQNQ